MAETPAGDGAPAVRGVRPGGRSRDTCIGGVASQGVVPRRSVLRVEGRRRRDARMAEELRQDGAMPVRGARSGAPWGGVSRSGHAAGSSGRREPHWSGAAACRRGPLGRGAVRPGGRFGGAHLRNARGAGPCRGGSKPASLAPREGPCGASRTPEHPSLPATLPQASASPRGHTSSGVPSALREARRPRPGCAFLRSANGAEPGRGGSKPASLAQRKGPCAAPRSPDRRPPPATVQQDSASPWGLSPPGEACPLRHARRPRPGGALLRRGAGPCRGGLKPASPG